jgi:hypothetical protein
MPAEIKDRERRVENDITRGSDKAWWIALLPVATCLGIGIVVFLLYYLL